MTETTSTAATPAADFKDGALYKALVSYLPLYVKEPFSDEAQLDVEKLRGALPRKKSHEAVYKWLRSSKLTPENASMLIELANTAANRKALTALNREPPSRRDFDAFVYAA